MVGIAWGNVAEWFAAVGAAAAFLAAVAALLITRRERAEQAVVNAAQLKWIEGALTEQTAARRQQGLLITMTKHPGGDCTLENKSANAIRWVELVERFDGNLEVATIVDVLRPGESVAFYPQKADWSVRWSDPWSAEWEFWHRLEYPIQDGDW